MEFYISDKFWWVTHDFFQSSGVGGRQPKYENDNFLCFPIASFPPFIVFISLVPINFSRNNKLTASPAVLLYNSAQLHLGSLAGERFTDIKQVDPVLES